MLELIALLLACALLAALIIPWVNLARLNGQKSELAHVKEELARLQRELRNGRTEAGGAGETSSVMSAPDRAATTPPVAASPTSTPVPIPVVPPPLPVVARESAVVQPQGAPIAAAEAAAAAETLSTRGGLEVAPPSLPADDGRASQDWFGKIAVWIGGIALLMAGFYMIKYSIDSGWMTPAVRVGLTAGFGLLLCAVGLVIGLKSKMAANERIGQALSGAGIACLYFAAYAAVHLYGFLGPQQGFGAMVVVTVLAVMLSLRNGAPIALMGLVGGFLTPWLMRTGSADTAMLFTYLFLLFCGAQFLCLRRGWWGLLLGSLAGAYIWSVVVIVSNLNGSIDNLEGTMLFVLGICLVNGVWVFLACEADSDGNGRFLLPVIRFVAWGGGLTQSLFLVWLGGFAGVDMALFTVLSLGALLLAVLREDAFLWAAWLALAAVAVGALSNPDVGWLSWLVWPTGLMGLFFAVGHWRGLGSLRAPAWRGFSAAAAILVVPVLYLNREILMRQPVPFDGFWLVLAAGAALLLIFGGEHLLRREEDSKVVGEYQAFGVFLLSFGLWTYMPAAYLAHAVAGLFVASALYWKWRGFGRAELVLGALAAAWATVMLPLAGEAVAYFFREDFIWAADQDGIAVLAWGLGVVGGGVAIALFARERRSPGLSWSAGLAALFGLVALYQWADQSLMPKAWPSTAVEGGLTALLAGLAVGCRLIAVRRGCGGQASGLLSILFGVRIVILHLGDSGAVGESFFFNALLLQFGVPFLAAFAMAWLCAEVEEKGWRRCYQISAMLLGFIWCSFLVQDYFGGSRLLGGHTSSTELYTYSVVWLLLAVVYQAIGLWRDQRAIHIGSLLLLLVTVGKVFLVDAAELEGLFRVLSFLGLGVALIGIGFFYNKVVFARDRSA